MDGNLVYIGHGEENPNGTQGGVFCLDASQIVDGKPKLVWHVDGIKAKFASPLVRDGAVYICNDVGALYCLDAKSGAQKWVFEYGTETKGSPVLADGKIYIAEADATIHILKPSDTECTEISKLHFRPKEGVPVSTFGSAGDPARPHLLHDQQRPVLLRQEGRQGGVRPAAAGAEGGAGRSGRQAGPHPGRPRRRDGRARATRWT